MSAPACRACGSARTFLRGSKPGEFLRREFEFHVCPDCGLMFVEPFSGFEIYDDAYYRGEGPDPYVDYAAEYHDWRGSDRMLEFEDLYRLAAARFGNAAPRSQKKQSTPTPPPASPTSSPSPQSSTSSSSPPSSTFSPSPQFSPSSPSPLRWLDFGCGAGGFLKYLRERGQVCGRPLDLTGHDVGSYASLLRTTDGFRILDLDALTREPAGSFDVISLIEVLEHLPSPLAPLQLVARLLRPGGLLLLTTGNLDSPVARRQGLQYRYCAPEIHVNLYNPRCLARLYHEVGLVPLPVRYDGAVRFKVLKSLRHRRATRTAARLALQFPPFVRLVDRLYGVSAMPCAVKPGAPA
ncbi:MAG: class I SAM-dependent methyltransferase [Verrucomicrobia bacterium]|nr:class I SAM-dependent methyltransferase [Verrucomicrobiota bacterium]